MSLVFEGRASALEEVANKLRKVDSNMTADILQRRIDEARQDAKMSVENDIAVQSALDKFEERSTVANPKEKPVKELDTEVFNQAFFGQAPQAPVWDAETKQWTVAAAPKSLLNDFVGERVSYGDFDGVLEQGPNRTIHLRLDRPYGEKSGKVIETINLGPSYQSAADIITQRPTLLTTSDPITVQDKIIPAGTPFGTIGKSKEKFVFPDKATATEDSFDIEYDDEGVVRAVYVKNAVSMKNTNVTAPVPVTGESKIQALAQFYGLDVSDKPVYEESEEGQLQFGFAEGDIKDDESRRILTKEELQAQTDDTIQQIFPIGVGVGGEQLGLDLGLPDEEVVTSQQARVAQVLSRFDQDILAQQEKLATTDDEAKKKIIRKELNALKKSKKNYSEDTIQLGSFAPQQAPAPTAPRQYRSWNEWQQQLDRDWSDSLNQIKEGYSNVEAPVDVTRLENLILSTPLRVKYAVTQSFSDVTFEELDAVASMANDIIDFAGDPENKVSDKQRTETLARYNSLVQRIETVQEYMVERDYQRIYDEIEEAGYNVTVQEPEPEPEPPAKASDLDTLHYLLSDKPQEISPTTVYKTVAGVSPTTGQPTAKQQVPRTVGTVTIRPFADKNFLASMEAEGIQFDEQRLEETKVVTIEGYDQDTKEILYKGEGGVTMRAPLSIVDTTVPTLREAIDANSTVLYDATQQAKKDAAAFKRRTSKPIQDRAVKFLTSVSDYVKKISDLNRQLEEADKKPASVRSSFVNKIKKQITQIKSNASSYINDVGNLIVDDIQWYESLDQSGKQEIIDSIRTAIYGQGGYKSVAPRAKVYTLRPEAKIPTTKVELPKGTFRSGTQEEQLVQELIEGGFGGVDLEGLGRKLALNRMFETETGMMKYPAFSKSTVENVQQEGQEVAETNSYIKNSNEFLKEETLKRYPQLGEFGYSSKAAKAKGKISTIGDGEAMLASIQVKLVGLDSRIEKARLTGAPIPDSMREQRNLLAEQLKRHKELISEEGYYLIGNKEYRTRLSQQYTGVYYPVDEEIVQGKEVTFGVFTNNFEITRAQIAAGLHIKIPDSFDRDLFNPAQHKSKYGDVVDGYYLPHEAEPYMVGTTVRVDNPRIDENGEQILDLRVTENVARRRLLVDRMVNPELMKVRVKNTNGEERFRSSRFRDFYIAATDSIVKRARMALEDRANNKDTRYPWSYIGMDNAITELTLSYAAEFNEYRLAQHVVKKALGSLTWKNLTDQKTGQETLARFIEEEDGMRFEYEYLQDQDYQEGESRIKTGPQRRVVSVVHPAIEFGDLPDNVRRQIITEEGNITDKIKATNLVKFVTEMMDGDIESIAKDIKAANKNIKGTDPHSVVAEYARRLFVNATVAGGKYFSLPNYSGSQMYMRLKGIANKYAKAEQDEISRVSLDALPNIDGYDLDALVGPAANDRFQAVLDYITKARTKLGAAGVPDLFESANELTGALTSSELAFVDRSALLADELYNTVQSDAAVGQAFRDIGEWMGLKRSELENLPDTLVVSTIADKLNTDYIFHTNKGAARMAVTELSKTEAGKRAAGLMIMRGWLPPVIVDDTRLGLLAPAEREAATPAATFDKKPRRGESPTDKAARELAEAEQAIEAGRKLRLEQASTKEIIDYSRQYLDAVQSLLPSINEASRIKSLELKGIEESRAEIYDSYRLIRALVGAMTPEEGGMLHTKTQKEIAEGIELGAPFVTSDEVSKFLSREVANTQSELTALQDKRGKIEQLFEVEAPRMLQRLNEILYGTADFTRDADGRPVPIKGGGNPPLLETAKTKKQRNALLAEVKTLQEKSTAILTFGRETMDSLDASIAVKEGQLQKAEARKNIATPVLLDTLFGNIERANQQINMQRGFISRLSSTVRERIKEEQASIQRLQKLEPWKRYVEVVTGLPVVAERSNVRTAAMERFIELANRSAADRKKIQDYASKRQRELAKALVDSGVNTINSGLLTTYVDPVDVTPAPPTVGAPVQLRFGEQAFTQAERESSMNTFVADFAENLTRDERDVRNKERAREQLAGIDLPTRGGKILSKPRAYDPTAQRVGDAPPELPQIETFEGIDLPTREVSGKIKPLSKVRAYDPDEKFFSLSQIDPSLRDDARAENLRVMGELGLVSGDPNSVVEALKRIEKTGTPRQQLIATLLSTAPDFIRDINFVVVELDLGFAGLYDRPSNSVVINLNEHNGRGLVDVLLHEYLHAPTVKTILNPRTAAQRKAVARIGAIRNFAIANAARLGLDTDPVVRLGLSSDVEFLTYALTAPEFQNILAGLTLPQQRSILRRIVDAILNIFGLDPNKHEVAADAIQELLDFTKMSLAHSGTFNVDNKWKALVGSTRRKNQRALTYSNVRSAELINDIVARYQEGEEGSVFLAEGEVERAEGTPSINVLEEIKRILPEGVTLVENEQLEGNMGARRSVPNTLFVNPNRVNDMVGGLSRANAKSVVRTAVDEELAHLASYTVFTDEDFIQVADELGDEILNRTAHRLFDTIVPDYAERQKYITSELESGNLRRSDIAAEWVRSQITRMATGRTREADIAFLYTNPSLLERVLVGLKEFIFKLKQFFKAEPTVGTAARISQASRAFRKLQNGGVLPVPQPSAANEYGDTTTFLNAVAGDIVEGQEDRTHYMIAIAGTGASKAKIKGIWERIQDKMYNLPSELRKFVNKRDGHLSRVEYNIEDLNKRWSKMREDAIAAGFTIEELGMVLGTTAPLVQGEARKELQRKVKQFKVDNATDPDLEAKADAYEQQLWQPEADKFYAQFRREQQAMENRLRAKGLGATVDYLAEFRRQINKDALSINLDEYNDVYLTRSYKFLTTEGWAKAAKEGGRFEVDGKIVDFDKLRVAALKQFEYDVDFDAKQDGVVLTEDQRNIKLVEKLDAYLDDLVVRAEKARDLGPLNGLKKDLNRLLRKKDFDAPLRELLGEVTDPFENAVRTAFNVGKFAANERFLKGFAKVAIENGLASRTIKPDMVLLFPDNQASAGELAGLYVKKDIAGAITEELGANGTKTQSRSMEQINSIGRILSKFSGLSITAKTLGSVGFYPRNFLGGMALTTAQGIVNPINFRQAMRLSIASNMQWNKIKANSTEMRDEIRRLTELQVLKDETRGRIAMDMLRGFANSTEQQFEELLDDVIEAQSTGKIDKIVKRFKMNKGVGGIFDAVGEAGRPTVEFLAGLNNIIDSAFKVNAYYYELGELQSAYGDTESVSKLEAEAALKVKLVFPTHSDQIDFTKSFNKSPFSLLFMPFLRWKSEVIRTMLNTPKLAMDEIKSGNAVMRNRGIKRLAGFSLTMAFGASVYGTIFATLFGMLTDDEDDERKGVRTLTDEELAALKEGLPEWQRAHGIFAQLLESGDVQVIDMSNILPYSQVTDIAGLISRGDVKGVAKYLSNEVLGTQIAATATAELMNNRDNFDQPIWLETDTAWQATAKMWKHLGAATLLPAIVAKGRQAFRTGEQNTKEILVGELTGARPIVHKLPDIEYRGMRRFKDTADAVVSLLYPLSSGKAIDLDEVEPLIDTHQAASNRNQERMHNFFNGMKSLGSTEASLAGTAKQMKFSKQRFGEALKGTNFPWVAKEEFFKKMYENKTRVGEQDPAEVANKMNEVFLKKADEYNVNFYR
jgi:cob(I)alamin adenosyltransferase